TPPRVRRCAPSPGPARGRGPPAPPGRGAPSSGRRRRRAWDGLGGCRSGGGGAGDRLTARRRRARAPHHLPGREHGKRPRARALAAQLAIRAAIPAAAHPLLAVELRPEAMRVGVARLGGGEATVERRLAACHALPVALVRRLERVELGHETAHVTQCGQLVGEHLVDAGGARLAAQRAEALRPRSRAIRPALGDDQMSGAQVRIGFVLRPGGVQLRPPALERAKDVEPFEDVVPGGPFHAPLIAPHGPPWEEPVTPRTRSRGSQPISWWRGRRGSPRAPPRPPPTPRAAGGAAPRPPRRGP